MPEVGCTHLGGHPSRDGPVIEHRAPVMGALWSHVQEANGIGPTLGWLVLTLITIGILIALMTWMLSQAAPGIAHLVEEYRRNHPRKETNH